MEGKERISRLLRYSKLASILEFIPINLKGKWYCANMLWWSTQHTPICIQHANIQLIKLPHPSNNPSIWVMNPIFEIMYLVQLLGFSLTDWLWTSNGNSNRVTNIFLIAYPNACKGLADNLATSLMFLIFPFAYQGWLNIFMKNSTTKGCNGREKTKTTPSTT